MARGNSMARASSSAQFGGQDVERMFLVHFLVAFSDDYHYLSSRTHMKTRKLTPTVSMFLVGGFCLISTAAFGELKTFTVDSTQSSLSVTGSFTGIPLMQQGANSLTAKYGGIILADVTGSTITFMSGSSITASNSGNWAPGLGGVAGTAPANYGGQGSASVTAGQAAVRNTVLDITSSPTTVTGGSFPAQSLQISFSTNASSVVDYSYTVFSIPAGSGSEALAGQGTNNILSSATLTNSGSELVLAIPINYSGSATVSTPNDIQFNFTGQFVARASASSPLEISSFQAAPGQLSFTIATTPGKHFTILGSMNLITWPTTNDQFTATNTVMTRNLPLPLLPSQFFRIRQDD